MKSDMQCWSALVVAAVAVLLGPAALAQLNGGQKSSTPAPGSQVWSVDPDNPQSFSDLQPAIDVARSGDVILVAPGHTYLGFVLHEGIGIRAESGTFTVDGAIVIEDIQESERATVMGFDQAPGQSGGLILCSSPGEIVLEKFSVQGSLVIEECQDVCADLSVIRPASGPALEILRSTVSMSGIDATGGTAAPGVSVTESMVTLAGPSILGGTGVRCQGLNQPAGPALRALESAVFLVGTEEHTLNGGSLALCAGTFRLAAPALDLGPATHVTVSRVQLNGVPHPNSLGSVTRNDAIPYLDAPTDIRLGQDVLIGVDGVEPGLAYVSFANHGSQQQLSGYVGPNWSLSDTGNLCIVPVLTDPFGDVNPIIPVPTYDAYLGVPIKSQVALIADNGEKYTSNTIVRTMGAEVP